PSKNTSLHQHEVEPDTVDPKTDVILVRRSVRISQAPERYGFYIDAEEHELGDHGEPPNYQAVLLDPESEKWLEAMNAEMQSMKDNQVWNLVDLPPNYIKAIRILIAITAYYDYEIWQMDVKTAFLKGRLNEDVYMVQPKGFVNPKHPGRVCKLQRSIYGLKQATRSWNKRFDEEIKKYGFTQNLDEPCVYKKASGSIIVFLILYVDDILLMGNNILMLQDVKSWLGKCFAMKDLGSIMYDVRCTRPDVAFSQNLTSRYQQNPRESHWTAVKNILKYLRNTKDMFLVYGGDSTTELGVTCYIDASAFDWKSSKQSTTAMSSMEAEYIATAEAAMEAIWIRKFISRLGVVPSIDRPIDMYCDNTGAITIADEPGVQRDDNLADSFTKPMPCTKHVEHVRSIGLRPASSFMSPFDSTDHATKIMAASAIAISSDSLDESVGSPPSQVILFGDIPTVIPSTSVVALETSTIAPVISSAAPMVETTLVASPTVLCGLVPYSGSDSDSPDKVYSPEHISPLPAISPFLCTDSFEAPDSSDGPPSQDPYVATIDRWRSRVTTRPSSSSEFPIAPVTAQLGIRRRSAILIQPREAIPFGRPYRTHLNGPRKLWTARKRVGPLPARRLACRHALPRSSDHCSSSSSSSLDSSLVHSSGLDAPDQAHSRSSTRDVSPRLCYPSRRAP
ncbi:retrotransposon protein, putative, ty1-copia subclass, partial [Tanacetum coccineum]